MESGGGIQEPFADGSGDVPEELTTETELRGAMYEEDGEGERNSDEQGFGASIGGWAGSLPRREEIDGREAMDGRDALVATLLVRLPREGRLFCISCSCACRIALPWTRQFMPSIWARTGS